MSALTGNFYAKAAGYSLCLAIPLMVPAGYTVGNAWVSPIVVFLVLPLLGLIIGKDASVAFMRTPAKARIETYLQTIPRLYVAVWLGTLAWGIELIAARTLPAGQVAGIVLGLALASAFATCVAHELVHRDRTVDRALGRIAMAACGFGHLMMEHLHHHDRVGDVELGGTPRRGESVYSFVARFVKTGVSLAWAKEHTRLSGDERKAWSNRVLQDYAVAGLIAVSVAATWGPIGFAVFVTQGVFALFCFEVITYMQHYGLERKAGERLGPQHAWAHYCWLTSCITLNITHHSDHHLNADTPYYALRRHEEDAPRLPACYFVMFIAALIPPLWRRVMDRQLAKYEGLLGRSPVDGGALAHG